MCGIFARLNSGGEPVEVEDCRRATAMLHHRGPDDSGEWLSASGDLYLGFRRLSILDLSGAASQPMHSPAGNVLIFNGEIYNYRELRRDLESRGCRFSTRGDTEALLYALETWGEAALPRLEGMFGFLYWEPASRRALIARDFFGVKPVYYRRPPGGGLWVASEAKCFHALADFEPRLNREGLPEYLRFRSLAGAETLLASVMQLRPGHLLRYRPEEDRLEERAYWDAAAALREAGAPSEPLPVLRSLFTETVDRHLLSDVPVGAQLSGGVDSTLSLAVAKRTLARDMKAFHCHVDEAGHAEIDWARRAASLLDVELETVALGAEAMFSSLLDRLTWHMDEPLGHPNAVGVHLLSALARPQASVLISGEGADEVFGGYTRYSAIVRRQLLRFPGAAYLPWPGGMREAARLARLDEEDAIGSINEFVSPERVASLLPNSSADSTMGVRRKLLECSRGFDPLTRTQLHEIATYLPPLLMRQDKMSMAASIENRVPFLTPRLAVFGLSLPPPQRAGWRSQKVLLKQFLCDFMPRDVVYRPKAGFQIPLSRWIRGSPAGRGRLDWLWEPSNPIYGVLDRAGIRAALSDRGEAGAELVWVLLTLAIWLNLFLSPKKVRDYAPASSSSYSSAKRVAA
jgi:asparagine synthase (glutamine-hydrolysing)